MTKKLRRAAVKFATVFIFVSAVFVAKAERPEFTWNIDFGSVFDNREGDSKITPTKTYFFTNLAPEIGIKFTARDRIAGGVVWNQPIGNEWDGYRISPTLYYRHKGKHWNVSLGMFPRTQLRQQLPNFLWCDSLTYTQRNIRGVLIQYGSKNAFFDFYLDWRQMQTAKKREAFNIVFHGQWHPGGSLFMVGGHAMMNHFALTKNAPDNQHIVDNFLVNPYVGVELAKVTPLDSLTIRAGALMTIERNRAINNWKTPAGGWLEVTAEWKWLGLKNTLYAGGKLLPAYAEHGSQLYQGEPYYQTDFYNRTDIYAYIFRNSWVNLAASLNFNFAKDNFTFYQRLTLRVYLNQLNCPLFTKKESRNNNAILSNPYL